MMKWTERIISAEAAAQKIQSGNRIFITGNCSTPLLFTKALLARHSELHNVEIIKLLDVGTEDPITPILSNISA